MFAIKRALKLNKQEATLMAQHAGFRRVVYNDALMVRKQLYDTDIKASDAKVLSEFKKVLTNHTKKQPQNAWMNKMSSRVYQNALRDLADAFSRFRAGIAKHPQPAKKKMDSHSLLILPTGR
jgi:putative transposase